VPIVPHSTSLHSYPRPNLPLSLGGLYVPKSYLSSCKSLARCPPFLVCAILVWLVGWLFCFRSSSSSRGLIMSSLPHWNLAFLVRFSDFVISRDLSISILFSPLTEFIFLYFLLCINPEIEGAQETSVPTNHLQKIFRGCNQPIFGCVGMRQCCHQPCLLCVFL